MTGLRCSAEGCENAAMETLFLREQAGHVHDCSKHAAQLREWCDVLHGEPLLDGECVAACAAEVTWYGQPRPLEQ